MPYYYCYCTIHSLYTYYTPSTGHDGQHGRHRVDHQAGGVRGQRAEPSQLRPAHCAECATWFPVLRIYEVRGSSIVVSAVVSVVV